MVWFVQLCCWTSRWNTGDSFGDCAIRAHCTVVRTPTQGTGFGGDRQTDCLTASTEQKPSREANSSSASQRNSLYLWKAKFHYRVQNSPPIVVLSQINPVHRLPSHLLNIYFSINPHLCLGLHNGPFTSGFPTQTLYALIFYPIHAACPTYLILLYLPILIITGNK